MTAGEVAHVLADGRIIRFYRRETYGTVRFYFLDPADERVFIKMTGRKTLEFQDMDNLKWLCGNQVAFLEVIKP